MEGTHVQAIHKPKIPCCAEGRVYAAGHRRAEGLSPSDLGCWKEPLAHPAERAYLHGYANLSSSFLTKVNTCSCSSFGEIRFKAMARKRQKLAVRCAGNCATLTLFPPQVLVRGHKCRQKRMAKESNCCKKKIAHPPARRTRHIRPQSLYNASEVC